LSPESHYQYINYLKSTHLFLYKTIANWAFLTLVSGSVVEIIQLTFVALVTHKALTAAAGTVIVTLHGNGAHWVTVTGWMRRDSTTGRWERSGETDKNFQ